LTGILATDLSTYDPLDYRRFIAAHLQLLEGLCQISIRSINATINQILTSVWVTRHLLSEDAFNDQIGSLINSAKLQAPDRFVRLMSMFRTLNHQNRIVLSYGTNFNYIVNLQEYVRQGSLTEPLTYDENCSCYFHANCTSAAQLIARDRSQAVSLTGLRVGCTPSESFFMSTLECFYDPSCINLIYTSIYQYHGLVSEYHPTALTVGSSRFSINTQVEALMNELFVEQWSNESSFRSYYQQCAPAHCSYTYMQSVNSIYTVTLILGIYGGLSIGLKLTSPIVILILYKLYQKRKNRVGTAIATVNVQLDMQDSTFHDTNHASVRQTLEMIPVEKVIAPQAQQ
jgi:hypothetical protein